jgi:transcription factor IIIB subunit 2
VCTNCFTQVAETNIVAELTFEENAKGGATVQGDYIGENARHASTMGHGPAVQRVGGTERNPDQLADSKGKLVLARLCPRLGIQDAIKDQALNLYKLSTTVSFSAGRRTEEVVGACLYAICRRQEENMVLLVDIAEILHINVFRLGDVFKTLCEELYIDHKGPKTNKAVPSLPIVHVESLIVKFCRRLEFGHATRAVAFDAVKIIQRMKRDWMVTGRHPAGLCGAAIILAARMNNFRRSVREVVWVVKVTDITIVKRVHEFRRSAAAALTVAQFREYGPRLKDSNDPPVLFESEVRKMQLEAKKRKRQEASEARDATEGQDDGSGGSSSEGTTEADGTATRHQDENEGRRKRQRTAHEPSATPAPTQQEPRRDADGFLIPALPTDNVRANEDQQDSHKRGRKKKDPPAPIVITEQELLTEKDLDAEIKYVLKDEEIQQFATDLEIAKAGEYAAGVSELQKKDAAERNEQRRQSEGITWVIPQSNEEVTADALEAEFADDPEVQNCLLSEEEQKAKEQIWVFNNEDWLRQQQEKKLIEAVAKAAGRNEKGKKPGKVTKKKRKGKMGDGTTLKKAGMTNATPAEAVEEMIRERTPQLSNFIDAKKLYNLFRRSPSSTSGSSPANNSTPNANNTSEEHTPANASPDAAQANERSTASTPAPISEAAHIQSPPPTHHVEQTEATADSPERRPAAGQPPASPPQTQAHETGGAEDEESEGDPDDYELPPDELDYGSDDGDDGSPYSREDIGEDDYQEALDPRSRWAVEDDDAYGNDGY